MGYVDNAPYFCMVMDTVANLANKAISHREQARKHLMEIAGKTRATDDSVSPEAQDDAIWEHLPAKQRSAARANVDVYLDDFI